MAVGLCTVKIRHITYCSGCSPFSILLFNYHFAIISFHRENNINSIIESTFSVENNSFGALVVHELKPGGSSIVVTEENKREYVKLYVNYRFMRGIEQQFLALQKGENLHFYLTHSIMTWVNAFYCLF